MRKWRLSNIMQKSGNFSDSCYVFLFFLPQILKFCHLLCGKMHLNMHYPSINRISSSKRTSTNTALSSKLMNTLSPKKETYILIRNFHIIPKYILKKLTPSLAILLNIKRMPWKALNLTVLC